MMRQDVARLGFLAGRGAREGTNRVVEELVDSLHNSFSLLKKYVLRVDFRELEYWNRFSRIISAGGFPICKSNFRFANPKFSPIFNAKMECRDRFSRAGKKSGRSSQLVSGLSV